MLALWREIAWKRTGSPIQKFRLQYQEFIDAEALLVNALQSGAVGTTHF